MSPARRSRPCPNPAHPRNPSYRDNVNLFVNKLTSTKTQIPFDYYALGYVKRTLLPPLPLLPLRLRLRLLLLLEKTPARTATTTTDTTTTSLLLTFSSLSLGTASTTSRKRRRTSGSGCRGTTSSRPCTSSR